MRGTLGVLVEILDLTHLQHNGNAELVHLGHLFLLEVGDFFHGLVHVHLDLARLSVQLLSLALELMHVGENLLSEIVQVELLVSESLNDVDFQISVSKLLEVILIITIRVILILSFVLLFFLFIFAILIILIFVLVSLVGLLSAL